MGNVLRLGIARVGLAINQWRANRKLLKKTIVILILGLQGVGKSTIALRLWKLRKTLPDPTYVQTKGFNTFEIRKKNLTIKIHDLGGHESVRELWSHYYADAHGIIFVVDSSKPEDLPEAGAILAEVLRDERVMRKPVLVLANKQDDPRAVSEVDLTRSMDLVTTVNSVRCLTRVDICAANSLKMDEGIFTGFKWLVTYIEAHYGDINARVQQDSLIEQEREKAKFNLSRNEARRRREEAERTGEVTPRPKSHQLVDMEVDANENGIDQVAKPTLYPHSTDEEELEGNFKGTEEIPERPSPEGAADSAEDLKYVEPKVIAPPNQAKKIHSGSKIKSAPIVPESNRPVVSNSNGGLSLSASHQKEPLNIKAGRVIGVDNPGFEPNEGDKESYRHQKSAHVVHKNSSDIHKLLRYRASSVRSNSTETDVELPGEIIMVTTKAEVHESQEMLDETDMNANAKCETNERTVSPTLSYISGHISHKTSMESINVSLGNDLDSASNSASKGKSRSRSSSTSKLYEKEISIAMSAKSNPHPTPLQKLANLKNRNKTAPSSEDREPKESIANGSALLPHRSNAVNSSGGH